MRLVLFEPDIPQNTGAVLRLGACLGVPVDVIEPCGFVWSDRHLKRVGLDYLDQASLTRHPSWTRYLGDRQSGRIILLTTARDAEPLPGFRFAPDDALLLGRESAGVPPFVHTAVDRRLRIPMRSDARALNVALAAALVLGEALRQTDLFPKAMP